MDKPVNILAKIEGSGDGKALLIFSHYDSALVPLWGASDAGSGVVTILECVRAYSATGQQPKTTSSSSSPMGKKWPGRRQAVCARTPFGPKRGPALNLKPAAVVAPAT